MKTVIFSGVVLILIIISIVFSGFYTSQRISRFETILNSVSQAVEREDWELSVQLIAYAEEVWEKTGSQLATLFHHDEIRDIGVAMASLKTYVMQNEKTEALAQIAIVDFGIKHITRKDKLFVENIF